MKVKWTGSPGSSSHVVLGQDLCDLGQCGGHPVLHAHRHELLHRLQATIGDSPSAHDALATAIDRQLEALNTLVRRVPAADHAVVVLAYGRVHPYVRVLLQRAADIGAQIVLITDTLGRRLTSPVAVQLNAGRGAPSLFATHGPTIVLLEALVLAIAATHPDRSDNSLATLNDLRQSLAGRRLDVDPD